MKLTSIKKARPAEGFGVRVGYTTNNRYETYSEKFDGWCDSAKFLCCFAHTCINTVNHLDYYSGISKSSESKDRISALANSIYSESHDIHSRINSLEVFYHNGRGMSVEYEVDFDEGDSEMIEKIKSDLRIS